MGRGELGVENGGQGSRSAKRWAGGGGGGRGKEGGGRGSVQGELSCIHFEVLKDNARLTRGMTVLLHMGHFIPKRGVHGDSGGERREGGG